MYAQVEKSKENKNRAVANSVGQKKSNVKQGIGFVDNRRQSSINQEICSTIIHSPSLVIQKKISEKLSGRKLSISDISNNLNSHGGNNTNFDNKGVMQCCDWCGCWLPKTRLGKKKLQHKYDISRVFRGINLSNMIFTPRFHSPMTLHPGGKPYIRKINLCCNTEKKVLEPGGTYKAKTNITYTGSRSNDYTAAESKSGRKRRPGEVWHHYHNLQMPSGQGDMYLMDESAHSQNHCGGVWQYEHYQQKHNNNQYFAYGT